jgi:hypothetical protein
MRYVVEQRFPFEDAGRSTASALAAVRLNARLDLAGELAYPGAEPRRAWLAKRPLADGATGIAVLPANAGERFDAAVAAREPLGTLRPVQRYVLRAALERAGRVQDAVREQLGDDGDPWGFVQIRGAGTDVELHVTPPIVEALHPLDWDDDDAARDFVVCDGNHRVVQAVWNEPARAVAAVAVLGLLPFPYYARPLRRSAWNDVARNALEAPPGQADKYRARPVDRSELRRPLDAVADADLYRRYFRDLASGFGSIGGQAGRESPD